MQIAAELRSVDPKGLICKSKALRPYERYALLLLKIQRFTSKAEQRKSSICKSKALTNCSALLIGLLRNLPSYLLSEAEQRPYKTVGFVSKGRA